MADSSVHVYVSSVRTEILRTRFMGSTPSLAVTLDALLLFVALIYDLLRRAIVVRTIDLCSLSHTGIS